MLEKCENLLLDVMFVSVGDILRSTDQTLVTVVVKQGSLLLLFVGDQY